MVGIVVRVLLALGLAAVPTGIGFWVLLSPSGAPADQILALLVQFAGLGLTALAAFVFWRLRAGATRPSWPFIFFSSGALNAMVWTVLVAIGSARTGDAPPDEMIDVSQSFPVLAFIVAMIWAIIGGVFGWLVRPGIANGRP